MRRGHRSIVAVVAAAVALATVAAWSAGPASAARTETWSRHGSTFRLGTFDGMIVHPDGRLVAGPARRELARPETALIWDLVVDERRVFAAAGEGAGLIDMREGQPARRLAKLDREPEILALARGGKGKLYLATGPSGAVYELDLKRQTSTEIFRPDARYIWDLAVLPDGSVAVATGLPGSVVRVDPERPGASTVLWTSTEPHVRCLAAGRDGRLVAGTVGSGWLVEIDASSGGGFVLFDSDRPEAVAVAIDDRDAIWAAFAGRAADKKPPEADREKETEAGVAHITVRPKNGNGENGEQNQNAEGEQAEARKRAPRPRAPSGGGELVRLAPDEEPVTLWSDGTETPMAIATHPEQGLLLGTAKPARVWWIADDGREGLWTAVPDVQAVSALSRRGDRVALASSNPSAVFLFEPGRDHAASWTSDVLDAEVTSRFGLVHAVVPRGAEEKTVVYARAGNTSEPETGWTSWVEVPGAAAPPDGAGGRAELPRARFLQLRVEIEGGAEAVPGVMRVEARYRRTNRPPRIAKVSVSPPGVAFRAIPPSDVTSGQRPVVQPADAARPAAALNDKRAAWRSKKVYEPGAISVTWEAQDLDGDRLTYDLEICRDEGAPCGTWRTIAAGLERAFHSFDGRTLTDGIYRFRVRARDDADNFPGDTREDAAVSDPVVVDHTPPEIVAVDVEPQQQRGLLVRIEARDAAGRVAGAEVATRPGEWTPIPARDGVADGASEIFEARLDVPQGVQSLGIRVTDGSGNVSLRRVTP